MNIQYAFVILSLLSLSNMAFAEQPAYEYMGLNINMTFEEIRKQYPNSNYQTTPETHSIYFWVSLVDVKGGIYSVDLQEGKEYWPRNRPGITPQLVNFRWLRLGFEKPDSLLDVKPKTWEDSHYLRLPTCMPILNSLIKRYGNPIVSDKDWEEQIEWHRYSWQSGEETMTLNCYKLRGKGDSLGQGIDLSRPN